MKDRSLFVMVLLTLLGMVGIYVGMYIAYQKAQPTIAKLQNLENQYEQGGTLGLLSSYVKK